MEEHEIEWQQVEGRQPQGECREALPLPRGPPPAVLRQRVVDAVFDAFTVPPIERAMVADIVKRGQHQKSIRFNTEGSPSNHRGIEGAPRIFG